MSQVHNVTYVPVHSQSCTSRHPTKASFDHAEVRFKLLIGEPFFVQAREPKETSVAAAFEREDVLTDEAGNRVFANDEPCGDSKRGKSHHGEQSKPDEENRYADECVHGERLPKHLRATAFGFLNFAGTLSGGIVAATAGPLKSTLGLGNTFGVCGALLFFASLLMISVQMRQEIRS